ncbi:MAG: 4-phosphopantetheinyl transferase [Bacteroidota bacterium]|nr:4-phosphopantetheinyl transferase [Bacteroidota bacterium]
MEHNKIIKLEYESLGFRVAFSVIIDEKSNILEKYIPALNPTEIIRLERYKLPKPQNNFCLGRYAAKQAINLMLEQNINFDAILVDNGVFGFPVLQIPQNNNLQISIAHTDGAAAAICFDSKFMIGLDMEPSDSSIADSIRTQLSGKEMNLFRDFDSDEYEFYLRLWTAKESLGKALKTGLGIPMKLYDITSIQQKDDSYIIDFGNFDSFQCISFNIQNNLFAISYPKKVIINSIP